MRLLEALRLDFADVLRWRPWSWKRKLAAELEKLEASLGAMNAYANDLEKQMGIMREFEKDLWTLMNDGVATARVEQLENQFKALYDLQLEMDNKQTGIAAQVIEFGNELEKLRLRLAVPVPEQKAERPKSWPERRRELEQEFATKSVASQENANAGKGKSS